MKNKINNLSDVFREAKKHLWDGVNGGGTSYICFAIIDIYPSSHHYQSQAVSIVQKRLGGYETIKDYLIGKLGVKRDELTNQRVQQYRKDWLTALEEEFKPKLKPKKGYRIHHIDGNLGNNTANNLTYVRSVK